MNKKTILTTTIAAILATGLAVSYVSPAFAKNNSEHMSATTQKNKAAEEELVKVSDDAKISLRDLDNARLAIFHGDTDQAQTYVDAAKTRIDVARSEEKKYALDIKAPKASDWYVPYNATFTVMDTFKPTNDKAKNIAKANKYLRKGKQKEAMETLKLSKIDVAISTGLLPVKFAQENIVKASNLVREGKYYQANLALKQVDDAVIIQTYGIDDVPKAKADDMSKQKSKGG